MYIIILSADYLYVCQLRLPIFCHFLWHKAVYNWKCFIFFKMHEVITVIREYELLESRPTDLY